MIFLDSDILSYYFSGDIEIHNKIKETIGTGEKIALTAMNVYEILKGFKWRNNKNKELVFNKFLETVLVSNNKKHYEGIEQLKITNWI